MISRFGTSVQARLENRLSAMISQIQLPGFNRVYCPDPHIYWLGLNIIKIQRGLASKGVQLILAHNRIQNLPCESVEKEIEAIAQEERWIEKISQYTIALNLELQISELEFASNIDGALVQTERAEACISLNRQYHDLKRLKPDLILLVQGYGINGTAARLLGAYFNIPIVSFENTALDNRLVWEQISGITVNRSIAGNVFWRYADSVSQEAAREYCNRIIANTKKSKKLEHASPDERWTGSTGRPMILYLGQVYTDSSILYGSYPGLGPEEVVAKLAEYCMGNGFDLVIKLHPKEASTVPVPGTKRKYNKLTLRKLREIEDFDQWIDSDWLHLDAENKWDTYGLIEAADLVLTINSQAGLEAAIRGKPVVTCGRCFYGNLGFTEDFSRPEYMKIAINAAREGNHGESRKILAQKFFYIFFEKYCIEKSVNALTQMIRKCCCSKGLFPYS